MAAAELVEPGERVLLCGGPGRASRRSRRGAPRSSTTATADAVVVGFHREFDYERMRRRRPPPCAAGARLIATNDDATYPTPDGPIPGGGAILAAIVDRVGVDADGGRQAVPADGRAGARAGVGAEGIVVGDRPDTDGRFAVRARLPVRPRAERRDERADLPVDPSPTSSPPTSPSWSPACSRLSTDGQGFSRSSGGG